MISPTRKLNELWEAVFTRYGSAESNAADRELKELTRGPDQLILDPAGVEVRISTRTLRTKDSEGNHPHDHWFAETICFVGREEVLKFDATALNLATHVRVCEAIRDHGIAWLTENHAAINRPNFTATTTEPTR
jgi:hypothetical protein